MDNGRKEFTFTEEELVGDRLREVGKDFGLLMFHNESDDSYRYRLLSCIDGNEEVIPPPVKKPFFYFLVWLVTFPWDILTFIFILFIRIFIGKRLLWENGLWCELKTSKWAEKYNGATFGHGGILSPGTTGKSGIDTITEVHEHVHVEQFEVSTMISFFISVFVFLCLHVVYGISEFALSLLIWMSGYLFFLVSGWLVAVLRGEKAYSGSQHEESAYAIAEKYERMKRGI